MRIVLAAICCMALSAGIATAQSQSEDPKAATDSQGRPLKLDARGMQDTTAPTNTPGGGAPASSPQGQTAPGHQAAPDGSSQVVVEPKK
jgi:hypothetical protein